MLTFPLEPDTKVDIHDLTHATVDGNGVFDVLMRAVNAHLQKEWSANRLKGTEYSTVYLGALESTMNASLQFLLARDKTNAELDILKQQLINLGIEADNATKQGLDIVSKTALTDQQKLNAIVENIVLTNTALKVTAEKELLAQKKATELANVDGTGVNASSVVGKQTAVLQAQADGYARDAEQKAAEILVRGYSVLATNQDLTATDSIPWGIDAPNTNGVLTTLMTGIGATPTV